jgi:hypothetical protein
MRHQTDFCISNSETRTKYNTWHTLTSLRLNSYWAAVVTGKLHWSLVFKLHKIESSERLDSLMSRAKEHNDLMMLKTLNTPDFLANAVYHSGCIRRYLLHSTRKWLVYFKTMRHKKSFIVYKKVITDSRNKAVKCNLMSWPLSFFEFNFKWRRMQYKYSNAPRMINSTRQKIGFIECLEHHQIIVLFCTTH